jgi:presenilin-like A22 family membrane protease
MPRTDIIELIMTINESAAGSPTAKKGGTAAREINWFALCAEEASMAAVLGIVILSGRPAAISAALTPPSWTAWHFVATLAAVTVIILAVLRYRKGPKLVSALFALAVFTGIGLIALRFCGGAGAAVIVPLAVFAWKAAPRVIVADILLVVGLAGAAWNLGLALRPSAAAAALTALAFYDILAVYGTRHMVKMAETLLVEGAVFALIVPSRPSGFFERVSSARPESGFMFLGTGDLVIPAMLCASILPETAISVGAALGAMAGLAATHLIFAWKRGRETMPALPPIAAGSLIGYFAVSLLIP